MPKMSEGLEFIIKHYQLYVTLLKISKNLRDIVMDCESAGEVGEMLLVVLCKACRSH